MVNFKICQQCQYGEYQAEERDADGVLSVRPTVHCKLTEDILLMNSNVPEPCPFGLEHMLSCQDMPPNIANYISGGPPLPEASHETSIRQDQKN